MLTHPHIFIFTIRPTFIDAELLILIVCYLRVAFIFTWFIIYKLFYLFIYIIYLNTHYYVLYLPNKIKYCLRNVVSYLFRIFWAVFWVMFDIVFFLFVFMFTISIFLLPVHCLSFITHNLLRRTSTVANDY